MNVALLSHQVCEKSLQTLKYFSNHGQEISLVLIETGRRKNYSDRERQFREVHDRYNRKYKKYPWYRRAARWFWNFIPRFFQEIIENNVNIIPILRQFSVEYNAKKYGVPIEKVKRHSSRFSIEYLQQHNIKYALLMSSNWLIKESLLSVRDLSIINVHPGYLPKHKGLDSLPWSILEDDPIGLTAYILDEGIDTGPILEFRPIEIEAGDTIGSLQRRMMKQIPEFLLSVLRKLEKGEITPNPQPKGGEVHRPMTLNELEQAELYLQSKN